MSRFDLRDKTAIITGAGSGIGQATSVALAKRGCHVIITDINENGLQTTADMLTPYNVNVRCEILDVGDKQAIHAFADKIHADYTQIDVLVNNAGVALGGTFEQVHADDFEWLMDINFYGVVRMTRALMPLLEASPRAQLVNISSVFGIIAPPGQTAYSASKFAVRGFSESLRHELQEAGSNVGVTQVHPGGIKTNIAKSARVAEGVPPEDVEAEQKEFERLLVFPAEKAGEVIVQGIEKRRDRVLIGNDAKIIAMVTRFFQMSYYRLLRRLL
jgi:short-subunit dehydrogenase